MKLRPSLLLAAIILFVAGCASPYSIPKLDQFRSSGPLAFNGIGDYLREGDVRVIWVHGMCDHDYRWAIDRRDALIKALNGTEKLQAEKAFPAFSPYVVRSQADIGNSSLEADFLVWGPLTIPYKDRLAFDNLEGEGGEFPYERARLNNQLKKTLMNRCLIDAVVYAGTNGDAIRHWVKLQVCEGLGGIHAAGRCQIGSAGIPARTVLVAESLGSKVLFDAIRAIWEENSGAKRAQAAAQLASIQSVFLIANQIPILDAADHPSVEAKAAVTGESNFLSILGEARNQTVTAFAAPLPPIQVVAFTDPNDLLSYRLSGEGLYANDIKVINVIVSNAPTYLGLFEMPDAAHCGYKWNKYVLGAVVFGYKDSFRPLEYSLPKECGLAG
jgi:hypothetical protein